MVAPSFHLLIEFLLLIQLGDLWIVYGLFLLLYSHKCWKFEDANVKSTSHTLIYIIPPQKKTHPAEFFFYGDAMNGPKHNTFVFEVKNIFLNYKNKLLINSYKSMKYELH